MNHNDRLTYIFLVLLIGVWIWYSISSPNREGYVSYASPWQITQGSAWNWWRRWWRHPHGSRTWKPRCPSGCQYTGRQNSGSSYSCPSGGSCFGNWCCKYDFDCKGCDWSYDGPRGIGQY